MCTFVNQSVEIPHISKLVGLVSGDVILAGNDSRPLVSPDHPFAEPSRTGELCSGLRSLLSRSHLYGSTGSTHLRHLETVSRRT